jgi:hypothetical protein
MLRNIVFAISQVIVLCFIIWRPTIYVRLGLGIVPVGAASFLYFTVRSYQDANALYLDRNLAAQTISPAINEKSGVVKFKRVVEAPSKLDWTSISTYRKWRSRCSGPSEPDYNLSSYGVIRSYW